MKTLKNILKIAVPVLVFSLVNACSPKISKVPQLEYLGVLDLNGGSPKNSEVTQKYNLKNKQVYEDFVDFLREEGTPNYPESQEYRTTLDKKFYFACLGPFSSPHIHLRIEDYANNCYVGYVDMYSDGLSNRHDMWGPSNSEKIKDLPMDEQLEKSEGINFSEVPGEKQLKLARDYTKALKEIMHYARYKGY